jgi:hypothetical protein
LGRLLFCGDHQMIQLISALCVLGVVIIALLIMTNAISLEEAIKAFGRGFALLIVALWAICVLKGLVAVAVSALRSLAIWIAIIAFVMLGFAVLVRSISRACMRSQRDSVKREGDYE